MPFLARVMGEAPHLRLITGIVLLSLHKPLDLAEQLATIDVMSGGRLTFGAGLGYREVEFDAFKVPRGLSDQLAISLVSNVFTVDPNIKQPHVHQFNLSVERELGWDTAVEARYVGLISRMVRRPRLMLAVFFSLVGAAIAVFAVYPTTLLPLEESGESLAGFFATAEGEPLYRGLGFETTGWVTRWLGGMDGEPAAKARGGVGVAPTTEHHRPERQRAHLDVAVAESAVSHLRRHSIPACWRNTLLSQ